MPRKPFWDKPAPDSTKARPVAHIDANEPLAATLAPILRESGQAGKKAGGPTVVRHTQQGPLAVKTLGFAENLSALYELWNAQRAELQASSEPLAKRVEALGRLSRVLPQLALAERNYKAKRGDKDIEHMTEDELIDMLGSDVRENS